MPAKSTPAFLLGFLVSACGGGGGDAPPGGTTPPPTVTEPVAPTINYGGNSQQVVIDKTNVEYFAGQAIGLRSATELIESFWVSPPATIGAINETVNGSGGGSAVIRGNFNSQNVG